MAVSQERRDQKDERRPERLGLERVEEQRQVQPAEGEGAVAEKVAWREAVSSGGDDEAADGLAGQDQTVGFGIAVQDVADERAMSVPMIASPNPMISTKGGGGAALGGVWRFARRG
ncbi:hypothetical protein GCM10009827_060230 [Dactylosporangium maewongense]|uniref:Uncharacterized protein n=1 Tax=Dactylosporangium maewongense TaxID=634393 RepID=A0ABP4M137_9ACTN